MIGGRILQRRFSAAVVAVGMLGLGAGAAAAAPSSAPASGTVLHSAERLAFLGASITEFGWNHPTGYVRLAVGALQQHGVDIVPVPAGVSGNTSRDMLARLQRDVLDKKPDWVTIDAGGNDVWHGDVPFDEYMVNMTAIVDRAQAAGIHVILQTCTPILEDLDADFNKKMAYFNQFLRYLAVQKHCLLCDENGAAIAILKTKTGKDNVLTTDGVHMNDRGNRLMAATLLRTLGLNDEQIARSIPDAR